MRIAILTTDLRESNRDYGRAEPLMGIAPGALLQGFAQLQEAEVHVVSCVQRPVASLEKIAPNIFYHSILVPKIGWLRTLYQGCFRATRRKLREINPRHRPWSGHRARLRHQRGAFWFPQCPDHSWKHACDRQN